MKKLRKLSMTLISLVLVITMVFSLTTSAFAQSIVDETVTQNTDIVSHYDEDASIRQGNIIGEDTIKRDEYT